MARPARPPLDVGEPMPVLGFATVGHGRLEVPAWFAGGHGVLLVYRAHW